MGYCSVAPPRHSARERGYALHTVRSGLLIRKIIIFRIHKVLHRSLLLIALLIPLWANAPAAAKDRLVVINSRDGVQQPFVLVEPTSQARAVLIMLPGGGGVLNTRGTGSEVKFNEAGFLQRSRQQFADNGFVVAIADTPSDQKELWRGFRMTERHAQDIGAIIEDLRKHHGDMPVYLIGISRGGLSVGYIGKYLQQKVRGIIAMSALYRDTRGESLERFDWSQLRQRVLIVGHRKDGCRNTLFQDSSAVARENNFPLIAALGGYEDLAKSTRAECGPWAHHNFLGIERPVAREIIRWILEQPFQSEVDG